MITGRTTYLISSFLLSVTLLGCGSAKDVDKIGDAQQCLNTSTASTAMSCTSKVDGMTSTGSYNIRCAAAFIREGFTDPTKYTTAFSQLNGSGGTANFMGLVSFSSAQNITTDASNANTTFSDCYSAGAKGKTLISAFGYFSTALMKFFYDISGDSDCSTPSSGSYNLNKCMQDAALANPLAFADIASTSVSDSSAAGQVQASIGSVIISTYTISCSGKGANENLCNTLKTAINNGGGAASPRGVFVSFFTTSVKPN